MTLERKTPLTRTGIKRGKPLARGSTQLKRTAWKPKPTPDPITAAARAEVEARSRGRCEARVTRRCAGAGQHVHHRKLRRYGDHRPVNLLHVCRACHDHIHANPAWSYRYGWLVRQADDPATALAGVERIG